MSAMGRRQTLDTVLFLGTERRLHEAFSTFISIARLQCRTHLDLASKVELDSESSQ